MYNRYVRRDDGFYQRIPVQDPPPPPDEPNFGSPPPPDCNPDGAPPPPPHREGRRGFLDRILDKFNLKGIDSGDLVLLLIIYLMIRDGEDEELLIALALLLIL